MRYWAIKTRYLESSINGDGKWHTHTTNWHEHSNDAWEEKDKFEMYHGKDWLESSSSLIHKER